MPLLGRSHASRWDIAAEHLAERYQQFFLIAIGETILVAGFAFTAGTQTTGAVLALATALVTSIMLWRIYFQRAGQVLAEAVAAARQPATIGRSVADTHLIMLVGSVTIAVGYELVIDHPFERPTLAWIMMVIGGPILYLAGRARFEYDVFARVSRSRWIAIVLLVLVSPLLTRAPALLAAAVAAVVLGGVAVADQRRAAGRPPEAPAPPR